MTARPLFLFAPGAGAPSGSDWMRAWAERLARLGRVETLDYPYRLQGRRAPDPLPVLIAAHREALAGVRSAHEGPVFLAGKSMGGRVGCHVALEEAVNGIIAFGYPLKAAGTGKLRDEVLVALRTPMLFLQGTRDALCPTDILSEVRTHMAVENVLHLVEGGDHSLLVRAKELKQHGRTQTDVDNSILDSIERFVRDRI